MDENKENHSYLTRSLFGLLLIFIGVILALKDTHKDDYWSLVALLWGSHMVISVTTDKREDELKKEIDNLTKKTELLKYKIKQSGGFW